MPLSQYRHIFQAATDADAPPLLLLHGTGGDEHDLVSVARRIVPGGALLSPRGDVNEQGSARFFRRFAEGVFDLDDVNRRAEALANWIRTAARHYQIDPTRLTALGFSNGANMAAVLLQLHPDCLGHAILLRPMVVLDQPAAPGSLAGKRVLLLNGAHDPIVPADHPARLAELLKAGGANVEREMLAASHGLTPQDVAAATSWLNDSVPR